MSGKKQHYIPQLLLKAFSRRPNEKAPPVWVYSRVRGIYQTNTKDTAAEREFYSPIVDGETTLDDQITSYENELSEQLSAIRAEALGRPINPELAAKTITHLTIRNDHTRTSFEVVGVEALNAVGELLSDADYVRKSLGLDQAEGGLARSEIRETIDKLHPGADERTKKRLEDIAIAAVIANFKSFLPNASKTIEAVRGQVEAKLGETSKTAQTKALTNSLAPEKRVELLAALKWTKRSGYFLLPDCIAVGISKTHPEGLPYLMADMDEAESIYFPIGLDRLLIGTRAGEFEFSDEQINFMSAASSGDFFVASDRSDEFGALLPKIGTKTKSVIAGHIKDAIEEKKTKPKFED